MPVNETDNSYSLFDGRFGWEKHSSGAAAKIMAKMGYKGKGLGKTESGITEPITIKPAVFRHDDKPANPKPPESRTRKLMVILSDSILNQMREK